MRIDCNNLGEVYVSMMTSRMNLPINNERLRIFKAECNLMNNLSEEFEGKEFSIDLDHNNKEMILSSNFIDMAMTTTFNSFYGLLRKASSCRISSANKSMFNLEIRIPWVWEDAE